MRAVIALIVLLIAVSVHAQTSPENARIPPGTIIDAQGYKWGIGLYPDPNKVGLDIDSMVYCGGIVYGHRIADNQWYRGTVGAGWTLVGPTDPCPAK